MCGCGTKGQVPTGAQEVRSTIQLDLEDLFQPKSSPDCSNDSLPWSGRYSQSARCHCNGNQPILGGHDVQAVAYILCNPFPFQRSENKTNEQYCCPKASWQYFRGKRDCTDCASLTACFTKIKPGPFVKCVQRLFDHLWKQAVVLWCLT